MEFQHTALSLAASCFFRRSKSSICSFSNSRSWRCLLLATSRSCSRVDACSLTRCSFRARASLARELDNTLPFNSSNTIRLFDTFETKSGKIMSMETQIVRDGNWISMDKKTQRKAWGNDGDGMNSLWQLYPRVVNLISSIDVEALHSQ